AARTLGLLPPSVGTSFATSTMRELATALDELADTGLPGDAPAVEAAGVADWVRPFAVDWTVAPLPAAAASGTGSAGVWTGVAREGHRWAAPVHDALLRANLGGGVLLCLRSDCDESDVGTMLAAARAALAVRGPARLVVLQHGCGATGLAKTLHLEAPRVATCVVEV